MEKKLEKLVKLAQELPESEKEKLNCVAQGMVLAQTDTDTRSA